MLSDKDAATSNRVMNAMLQMEKLDLNGLQQAYDGKRWRGAAPRLMVTAALTWLSSSSVSVSSSM